MTYVYLLSVYGEHGAEDVVATLDRSKVMALFEASQFYRSYGREVAPARAAEWRDMTRPGLAALLDKPDEELVNHSGHNCSDGWGGLQFHVVRLA